MNIEVLDCTLRDGGYVNDWDFGKKNIQKVVDKLTEANLDLIECGFLSQKGAYNPDRSIFDNLERFKEFLPNPSERKDQKYICMINYGEYNIKDIPEKDPSSVDGIRIAFHKKDSEEAIKYCEQIKNKGYLMFPQAMVTMNYSDSELIDIVHRFNKIDPYSFYIVDSFGNMKQEDLIRFFSLVDHNLKPGIKIGYHSHDNMELAYSNSQALIKFNAEKLNAQRDLIFDSSVLGMGRGAGNLNTELFVNYLNENLDTDYKIPPILQIAEEILSPIHLEKPWGYSLPYYLSAINNCHPNYATALIEKDLPIQSIEEIIKGIPLEKRNFFDKGYINNL
jgi:4-hydroxy 2-oxovalerate aldolase